MVNFPARGEFTRSVAIGEVGGRSNGLAFVKFTYIVS